MKRRKGKWKQGMMIGYDCNLQPIRVGDYVRLRYDHLVGFGEFDEAYVECEVCGCPKNGLPVLVKLHNSEVCSFEFDPVMDLEVIALTEEQEAILNADMETEMMRLQPELYEV